MYFQSNVNGQSLCLENGALVKMYWGDGWENSIMTQHPKIYYSPSSKTLYIAVMNLAGDYAGVSGGYITNIKSSFVDTSFTSYKKNPGPNNDTLYVCMRTNYTGAWDSYWNDYFESTFGSAGFSVEHRRRRLGPDTDTLGHRKADWRGRACNRHV